jgi:hypothetical protein
MKASVLRKMEDNDISTVDLINIVFVSQHSYIRQIDRVEVGNTKK